MVQMKNIPQFNPADISSEYALLNAITVSFPTQGLTQMRTIPPRIQTMDMEKIVMTYDDLRGVVHDLKGIGAHNVTAGRKPGLMGKTAWQRLEANYETLRRNGKLPATYEVVYGHAWKPEIRPSRKLDDGSQIIEFMRPTRTA